ncbi:MAG: tRNA pseudouridine(55) synthase TruB [Oscillospiraceae bacterium]|jgi:tRNA pseudouridine55 synthase|nr:tRNA pseudouridine(55) synthase TruB [Oscillospiraceae bacterium]
MTGIIVIDKPAGWSSHDVAAKMRGVLKEKRIGHGGTLDPMATGVLPLFVGRATRAVEFMDGADKEYIAGMRLGVTTDTQDITGNIIGQRDADVSPDAVAAELRALTGERDQLPPMYSAIKVNGKKLYEYARRGREVERSPRRICIYEVEPLGFSGGEYRFRVVCSKGTYVRTLCHDVGEKLGCGAAMSSLKRTRAGCFGIEEAISIESAQSLGAAALRPTDVMFGQLPALTADGADERRIRCGNPPLAGAEDGRYRIYSRGGEFLALGEARDGRIDIIKSFFEV